MTFLLAGMMRIHKITVETSIFFDYFTIFFSEIDILLKISGKQSKNSTSNDFSFGNVTTFDNSMKFTKNTAYDSQIYLISRGDSMVFEHVPGTRNLSYVVFVCSMRSD